MRAAAVPLASFLAALGCSLALGFQTCSRGLQPCRLLSSARICDARRRRLGSILCSAGGQGEPSSLLPWERERLDDEPDSVFYQSPRLVYHADASQLARLNSAFREVISPGSDVLDLMSSWASHFDGLSLNKVSGLGMNEEELRCNPVLDDYVVHDLNLDPSIPHLDNSFDAVTISFGFQYLVHPEDVMREVGRVLRPGGKVFVSFSEDCYESKATRGWLARDSSGRVMLIRQVLSAAGFSDTRFHEGSLMAEWESSTASTSPSDEEYRFRDQGLLFFVSSTVGESAAAPGGAVAGGAEVANRKGGVKVEEGGDVDDGVFMVNLEPSSPIVWQQRFYSLVQEAAGLGIPPEALEKYNPAVGGGEPTPDQWREGMASVQNVIASRLSSNL